MSKAELAAREAAAQRYYAARLEWNEVGREIAKTAKDLAGLKIRVTVADGWRMAMNLAEQGGMATALEFRNRAPSALLWFSTLPEWQRRDFEDFEAFENALEEMEFQEAMSRL